jgi:hypothetical protein
MPRLVLIVDGDQDPNGAGLMRRLPMDFSDAAFAESGSPARHDNHPVTHMRVRWHFDVARDEAGFKFGAEIAPAFEPQAADRLQLQMMRGLKCRERAD